jgi:hypothetical protein
MRLALCLLVALLLAACSGQPLPADKLGYAGEWRSETVQLVITPDGNVHYRRVEKDPNVNVSIDAPIKRFEGNDFYVGVGPFTTKFVVAKPPTLVDGQYKMTVDGRELTRTRSFGGQQV